MAGIRSGGGGGGYVGRRDTRTREEIEREGARSIAEQERLKTVLPETGGVVGHYEELPGGGRRRIITREELERAYSTGDTASARRARALYGIYTPEEKAERAAYQEAHRKMLAAASTEKAPTVGTKITTIEEPIAVAPAAEEYGPAPAAKTAPATEMPTVTPGAETERPRRQINEMRREVAGVRPMRESPLGFESVPFVSGTSTVSARRGYYDTESGYWAEPRPRKKKSPWEI